MSEDLGRVATAGGSYRARAEARQREYRSSTLRVGWSRFGHWLDGGAAAAGANFVVPEAREAADRRDRQGKGVNRERTFGNMLSSQAMCFNLFAPLAKDPEFALVVLRPFFPILAEVRTIAFEYTPPNDVFGDQTGRGGVDCDLLVEGATAVGEGIVIAVETKFVEPEFSTCGFRKAGRKARGQPTCPQDVPVLSDHHACLYDSRKRYLYWLRATEHRTLSLASLPEAGCPFGGPEWQLWVNHTLAHAEAARRAAKHAVFAVCAPASNTSLLRDGVLESFRARLSRRETFVFLPLDELLAQAEVVSGTTARRAWSAALLARYGSI
jgi:hypothetical protein